MQRLVMTLLILSHGSASSLSAPSPAARGDLSCRWLHGRLSAYNGTPTLRLWEVGTHHLFGIGTNYEIIRRRRYAFDDADEPELPRNVEKVFHAFQNQVFGDFEVCPVQKLKPGHMQPAQIRAAKNLIVQSD